MQRLTIDTSVYVSLLEEADALHEPSLAFFNTINQAEISIVVPATVPLEVVNAVIRYGRTEIQEVVRQFLIVDIMPIDRAMIEKVPQVFHQVRLKTADALVVFTASAYETTLISWDKQLLKEAAHIVPAMTPSQYLAHHNHLT